MRKVEVLCLTTCPAEDCDATVRLVTEALAELGIEAEVTARVVSEQEAALLRLTRSPVIRMDGVDLFFTGVLHTTGQADCWIYSRPTMKKALLRRMVLAMIGGLKRS